MKTLRIHEQIRLAVAALGWSMADFAAKLAASKRLRMHRTLVHKKLVGDVPMSTREAESFADTLRDNGSDITLVWPARSAA